MTTSVIGGTIIWELTDDFETSRNVTFTMITIWDSGDLAYQGTGVQLTIGSPPSLPQGSTYADRFGQLLVEVGHSYFLIPNAFVIKVIDDTLVDGWLVTNITFPPGAYVGNASLVQSRGEPLKRSQQLVEGGGGSTEEVKPEGGLQRCKEVVGASPVPCERYMDGLANPTTLDLRASFALPDPSQTSKWINGKIRNRNAPHAMPRFVTYVSAETVSTAPRTAAFQVPFFDRDGDPVVVYPAFSTQAASGTTNLACESGTAISTYGCNGFGSGLDGPPYDSTNFIFKVDGKVPSDSLQFYYSFTLRTSDGTNIITTELVLCYFKPEQPAGERERVPEFVTHVSPGVILRKRPPTTLECELTGPCYLDVYAVKFSNYSGLAVDPLANNVLSFMVEGPQLYGTITNQSLLTGNIHGARFVLGALPTGTHALRDIASHRIVCFTVTGWGNTRALPLCITVKIRGRSPYFLPPTPPMVFVDDDPLFDVLTPAPVCAGFTVTITIKAADPDAGENVRILTEDATGDGQDLFSAPYNALKQGNYSGTTAIAEEKVVYALDYASGVARDPVTRAISFAADRLICSTAIDNTLTARLAFGDVPDGNFRSRTKCHQVSFSGPPAFVTTANRLDATPFAALDGSIDERARVVDAFINQEKEVTFRAKDPNNDGETVILMLEDPGIPNGASVGPSICEPQNISESGVFSECSFASRVIKWTPQVDVDYTRIYRICAVVRDSTPIAACVSEKMTATGWFGEEHCVDIRVVAPAIRWTSASDLGGIGTASNITKAAFVPCVSSFILEAEDTSVGINGSAISVDSPYTVIIEPVGVVPSRVTLVTEFTGRISRTRLVYVTARGDEGREDVVCFTARNSMGVLALEPSCVTLAVKRCVYCIGEGDTLRSVMRHLALDFNWVRLWAANGNDDGDPDTTTVTNPDILMNKAGRHVINVGSVYTVEQGDTLHLIASRFQTTIRELLSVNPDLAYTGDGDAVTRLDEGHPLCIIPCSMLPELPAASSSRREL